MDDFCEAFFTSSTVPFAIADHDGLLVDANPAFARVMGRSLDDLRGSEVAWVDRYSDGDGRPRTLRWTTWPVPEQGLLCGIGQDVTEETGVVAQLSRMAYDDQLTGLANRARLLEAIKQAVRDEQRAGSLGVLFLDVDGFKAVNDRHGHAAGDALLRELGGRLRRAVRRTDVLARLGGDEFVVALPGLPEDVREVRAAMRGASAHLLDALRAPFEVEGAEVQLGGSVGAAAWPWSGASADELLAAADEAMYEAKRRDGSSPECALHPSIA